MRHILGWACVLAAGVLVLVAVVMLPFVFRQFDQRLGLYWYDTKLDYRFGFTSDDATIVRVQLTRDGFELPSLPETTHTAFLRMSIAAGTTSFWFEPWVEIESEPDVSSRQFFERRARGIRYVHLGQLTEQPSDRPRWVRLRGHHLSWEPQTAELIAFPGIRLESATILVVAPHPDDAEIAAFGLYAFSDAFVLTVTAGNYSRQSYGYVHRQRSADERLQGLLRVWDSIVVPLWGGIPPSKAINLGYFQGSLEKMHADPAALISDDTLQTADISPFRKGNVSPLLEGRNATSSWKSLLADLTWILEEVRPDIIVAPHPVLDASSDHRFTTLALFEALERTSYDAATLLLYTNHQVGAEYYPFGPSDGLVTLPPWFDETLPMASVYSHALAEDRQIEKLFALDAMHDLRAPPRRELEEHTVRVLRRAKRIASDLWRDPHQYYSYYRRAIRPNELFFVYPSTDRARLSAYVENYLLEAKSTRIQASSSR